MTLYRVRVRIICPYTDLHPDTYAALASTGRPWETHNVAGSDTAYTELLESLWADGKDFAVIEQDIVIHPLVLPEFEECPEVWCTFTYPYLRPGYQHAGLGCVRFRAELMWLLPDAVTRTRLLSDEGHPSGHWCRLDGWLHMVLRQNTGLTPHLHGPTVSHMSLAASHGCQ